MVHVLDSGSRTIQDVHCKLMSTHNNCIPEYMGSNNQTTCWFHTTVTRRAQKRSQKPFPTAMFKTALASSLNTLSS
jgi:hypothetical protein